MSAFRRICLFLSLLALLLLPRLGSAVELRVNRDALERTLRQQMFSGPNGRFYIKGTADSGGCTIYAENPRLSFSNSRIVVELKTTAQLGKSLGSKCLGITVTPTAVLSLVAVGEGEIIGYQDPKMDKILDQKELNFLLTPFLTRQLPAGMKVNAAELLRQTLAGSTARSGYGVSLDAFKIHSIQIQGDDLIVDMDGRLSVR